MFADDTNLFFTNSDLTALNNIINTEPAKISKWFQINKLSLNLSKTKFIVFMTKSKKLVPELKVKIDNTDIKQVKQSKFLGVIINQHLT